MIKGSIKLLLLSVTLYTLLSCQKNTSTVEPQDCCNQQDLSIQSVGIFGNWRFVRYDGKKPSKYSISMEIKNEINSQGFYQLSGKSPVNFYFSSFSLDKSKAEIKLQGIGGTKMAGPQEEMEAEYEYWQKLGAVTTFRLTDDNQTLIFSLPAPQTDKLIFTRLNNNN
jgi:heat shock protein HslJ